MGLFWARALRIVLLTHTHTDIFILYTHTNTQGHSRYTYTHSQKHTPTHTQTHGQLRLHTNARTHRQKMHKDTHKATNTHPRDSHKLTHSQKQTTLKTKWELGGRGKPRVCKRIIRGIWKIGYAKRRQKNFVKMTHVDTVSSDYRLGFKVIKRKKNTN